MANSVSCRLCSGKSTIMQLTPLFGNKAEKMLKDLTAMKITQSDRISSSICSECLFDLESAYKIQQRILTVEKRYNDEIVAEFLIQNHDELMKIIQQEKNKIGTEKFSEERSTSPIPCEKDFSGEASPVKHRCEICPCKFQFSPDYVKHLQQHILENKQPPSLAKCEILCEHCGDICPNSNLYEAHVNEIHRNTYECHFCFEKFATSSNLDEHVKQKHTNKKRFVCDVCHERFAVRYILSLHKAQHAVVKPFACDICGQKFRQNSSLSIHRRIKHIEVVSGVTIPVDTVKKQLF